MDQTQHKRYTSCQHNETSTSIRSSKSTYWWRGGKFLPGCAPEAGHSSLCGGAERLFYVRQLFARYVRVFARPLEHQPEPHYVPLHQDKQTHKKYSS